MSLAEYTRKRDFKKTREPKGFEGDFAIGTPERARYAIQKHDATRLHYDLRLESDGVLLSWAIPKGPSLDPNDKRLAVRTEDHPLEYISFEGTIPKGEYGGGTVMVWDSGSWTPKIDVQKGLKKGHLPFTLHGEKLKGDWHLARMGGHAAGEDKENWLLIKSNDDFAVSGDGDAALRDHPTSAISGRDLDAIANAKSDDPKIDPTTLSKAKRAARMPASLGPQLATLTDKAPKGDDWIHEIKYDGYRMLAFCSEKSVVLKTRNDHDWTSKFPAIAKALEKLSLDQCIIDGELIAIGPDGVSDFQALQNAIKHKSKSITLHFMVFDLPFALGVDLSATPLLERKRLLKSLLGGDPDGLIRYSEHIPGSGNAVFERACEIGLEGIICKKKTSGYISKRSRNWLKVKCERRQEFIICGFTEPTGSRRGFGALHLAYYSGKKLRYAGKVGTGFNDKSLVDLRKDFQKLAIEESPLPEPPADSRRTTWIKPELVAEIKYAEQTKEGLLRHPVFLGLRADKPATEVRREVAKPPPESSEKAKTESASKKEPPANKKAASTASRSKKSPRKTPDPDTPKLTNPERVLYPDIGATKERIAKYYEGVAEWMLPHVANRPLSLLRHPKGWTEKGFFQKHVDESFPDAVKHVEIPEGGSSKVYGYVTSVEGIVGLLQMGTLEIHAWGCRVDDVEKPDLIVMDLDPDDGLPTETVVGAALLLHDLLKNDAGLESFLKSTGGKGLHVVIPIRRGPSWEEVKAFSKAVAEALRDRNPNAFTTTSSKQKRKGKIYIDYLRNGRGATAIAPFSTRARAGATVALPLSWSEATPSLKSNHYTINNALQRLSQLKQDPWLDFSKTRQGLTKAVKAAFGVD